MSDLLKERNERNGQASSHNEKGEAYVLFYRTIKRAFDFICAGMALLVLSLFS